MLELRREGPLVQNAGDLAADLLRLAILDGRLKPGERLKESVLAATLQISRTPVRDALRILQKEGLIVAAPNRGAVVRRYTLAELRDVYELRALLEGHAARRAAEHVTPVLLRQLEESCRRADELRLADAPLPDLVRENERFHDLVLVASGSEKLRLMARAATEMPLVYRTYSWYSPDQRKRAEGQHETLTAALAAGDADGAKQVMEEHIFAGWQVLAEHLEDFGAADAA